MQSQELILYHFNDVYHIDDTRLIARFAHLINSAKVSPRKHSASSLRVFSGDAFSPSLESSVLKGEHMIPVLNNLGIDVACYGNHDFDFGEKRLVELSRQTNFPWLLSNAVRSSPTDLIEGAGELLACAKDYVVKDVAGYRLGFFGLAGTDWPSNCQHLPSSNILPPVAVAQVMSRKLREIEKCDFVIAITHMRLKEDLEVSNAVCDGRQIVDLILGGHDHEVICRLKGETEYDPGIIRQGFENHTLIRGGSVHDVEGDIRIVKSGSDWRGLSIVRLLVDRHVDKTPILRTIRLSQYTDLRSSVNYNLLPESSRILTDLKLVQKRIQVSVKRPLCHSNISLEGRSCIIRSQETNLGNLLADIVRTFYDTQIGFVNSGSIRCNRIVGPTCTSNPLLVKDIIDIMPFDNAFVVKRVSGATLFTALENSISDAHTDGRFLQCSGLRIVGNWGRREGERISEAYLLHSGGVEERIQRRSMYTVAMSAFIADGFDGYGCFLETETLMGKEGSITDTNLMLQVFGHVSETSFKSGAKGSYVENDATTQDLPSQRGEYNTYIIGKVIRL